MRGGDFPITNAESRDPHVVDLDMQAFAFGPSQGGNLLASFDCSPEAPNDPAYPAVNGGCGAFDYLTGSFGDGLPDTAFLYDAMPDTDHPLTPEYATAEDAKVALVKFLLSLTDPRVKLEKAPFDRPEIFVPIDGAAPENTGGPTLLAALSGVPCPVPGPGSDPLGSLLPAHPGGGGGRQRDSGPELPGHLEHAASGPEQRPLRSESRRPDSKRRTVAPRRSPVPSPGRGGDGLASPSRTRETGPTHTCAGGPPAR